MQDPTTHQTDVQQAPEPEELEPGQDRSTFQSFFRWWYALTAISETEDVPDPLEREIIRKSRLLSVIVFFLLVIFVLFIPGCLALPNRYVLVADLGMMVICVLALFLNRAHKPMVAGVLLVLSFEAALMMVVLTTQPLDEPSIQQYELFVFGELLAVSLLSARSVFFVALFNSVFICLSLLYQPQTPTLAADLQTQFWPMLLRPVGVQLLVAGVTYLWVSSASNYLSRAYRAEKIATAAQQTAEKQREIAEQDRLRLQTDIERVVHNHATAMNRRLITKIPLQEYEPVLWPLINVFNSLQNRLQHTQQVEQSLKQLNQAISQCAELISSGKYSPLQPLQTKTNLDLLLTALREHFKGAQRQDESSHPPFYR
uniref:HAMP domain-containing protein n=1 Tax=Thermosporothrix sp. COM3 TaxID=2490863 RepID=A0A455SRI2_9CHLR|nr:hypothetical protein KTC_25350 [Thermosporothrix sp. COM3]